MLSDIEIISACQRMLENSIGSVGSDSRWDTTRMLDQYHGRPYGTEVEGRSQVVTREVLEQVEWAMPSLLKVFGSGERVVTFTPQSDDDEAQADQETDYVNYTFLKDSNGWDVLNQWFRSALLERNAYVKVYWDTQRQTRVTTYEGMTETQVQMVLAGMLAEVPTGYKFEAVEVLEQTSRMIADEMTGEEVEAFDLRVREVSTRGVARAEYVPREEIRISKEINSLNLDDAVCTAHVRDVTKSDLIEMGFDRKLVERLSSDRTSDLASNTVQYARQTERSTQRTEYQAPDDAGRMVQLKEAYIRLDVDEDGVAELNRVVYVDEELLEYEEVDCQPFVALCPIPQPGVHVGMGLGDLVEDIQRIKTHLMRSILDNLGLTNNPEKEVVWDNVEFPDDFKTSVVGGLKRVSELGTIREMSVPFSAGASVPILELLDSMKEARTGISRSTMGLDADVLSKSTLGAAQMGMEQANQRLEMIARTFAETGVTWLFVKLRGIITRYQDVPRMVRLRGEFVEVDPRDWSDRTDTTAQVGLGTGRTAQTLNYLQAIAVKQEEHLEKGSPMVSPQNLYNTYERMIEAAGFKDASSFWMDPDSPEYQQAEQQRQQSQQQQQAQQAEAMKAQLDVAMADVESRITTAQIKAQSDMAKTIEDFQKFLETNRREWASLELQHAVDVPGEGVGPGVVGSETVQ